MPKRDKSMNDRAKMYGTSPVASYPSHKLKPDESHRTPKPKETNYEIESRPADTDKMSRYDHETTNISLRKTKRKI